MHLPVDEHGRAVLQGASVVRGRFIEYIDIVDGVPTVQQRLKSKAEKAWDRTLSEKRAAREIRRHEEQRVGGAGGSKGAYKRGRKGGHNWGKA